MTIIIIMNGTKGKRVVLGQRQLNIVRAQQPIGGRRRSPGSCTRGTEPSLRPLHQGEPRTRAAPQEAPPGGAPAGPSTGSPGLEGELPRLRAVPGPLPHPGQAAAGRRHRPGGTCPAGPAESRGGGAH